MVYNDYKNNCFSVAVIGGDTRHHPCWKNPGLTVSFLNDPDDLVDPDIDFIFLADPVVWDTDGSFQTLRLEQTIERLRLRSCMGIVLTSIMPIGVSDRLGCHYLPFIHPIFGCNVFLPFDMLLIRSMLDVLFPDHPVIVHSTRDAEMRCLVETCQKWINQSFYREISQFCLKNRVKPPFLSTPPVDREMTPILTYMIRQIEDTRLDCPLLYSCLFRHNYIDIPI
jgi:hypothetical protein